MFNLNSSYGQQLARLLPQGIAGKAIVVGSSSVPNVDMYREVFVSDQAGVARFAETIDKAVNLAKANGADHILVLPGHTESISSATALNLDVAGITILGLGNGNDRPVITLDTATTATIPVSAANITVKNIIFSANFADIVSVFTLTTAANFRIEGCYFKSTAANMNFLYVIDTDAVTDNAAGLQVIGNKWIEPDTATLSMIKMDGDNSDIVIRDNFLQLGVNNNEAAIMAIITGKSVFNAQILKNRVFRLNTDTSTGAILVTTDQSDNSGVIAENFAQHADTAAELLVTASSGFGFFENYASGVAGASGYLLPAADS